MSRVEEGVTGGDGRSGDAADVKRRWSEVNEEERSVGSMFGKRERECLGYYWKLLKFKKRGDILLGPFVSVCVSQTIKLQIQTQKGFS